MKEFIVKENKLQRIDKYLAQKEELSRVTIQRLIEEGYILVNNEKTRASYTVLEGDKITIEIPQVKKTSLKAQDIPLDIIYEDKDIIVINKPKGMVVHPANRKSGWNISKCYHGTLQRRTIRNRRRIKTRNSTSYR